MTIAGLVHQLTQELTATPECQFFNVVGAHPLQRRAWESVRMHCGLRTNLKRRRSSAGPSGEPSQFAAGGWVRVLDRESIQRTLSAASKTRGLLFLPYQWDFCDRIYRVQAVMRRMVDDDGVFRPVSRTVLLAGVDCGGTSGTTGCGRRCPIMWRDEWLQVAAAPATQPGVAGGSYVRVRSADEIRASLDASGKRDGLLFMPEMYRWTGRRLRVLKQVQSVFEYAKHAPAALPIYILEGLQCSGAILGEKSPCDRRCSILWHGDWLRDDA